MHHDDWPSDVTVTINGVDLGIWTSPADFGGQRGLLTPSWWDTRNSQFGLLKEWRVTDQGTWIDGVQISGVTLDDLALAERRTIDVRIGVDPNARHVGGVNLFGSRFGNYPEDLTLTIAYREA
jgi:Predicted transcriptional regulator